MATKNLAGRFEAAGWLFWLIVLLVLLGPFIYYSFGIVREDTPVAAPVAIGAILAAVASAVITTAVNAVLQRIQKKKRMAVRKKGKK